MKMLFKHLEEMLLFTVDLNLETRTIEKVHIEKDAQRASKLLYPEIETPSYDSLEKLVNGYFDTSDVPLSKLVEHIKKKGFYTPYKPNLRIKIE